MTAKYWAIIPAAGIGARMQADRPKSYLLLNDKPVLSHVIEAFDAVRQIEKIVIVLNAKDHWWPTLSHHSNKIMTVIGGRERVHSVLLGLTYLAEYASPDDWVIVHDAARPCITASQITEFIQTLSDEKVGGLMGLPVSDTLKYVENDVVEKTVSRQNLWHAQTPQMFRYEILKQSIETALSKNTEVTDESSAIEYANLKPTMVMGHSTNIKITFPEDLILASHHLGLKMRSEVAK